MKTIILYTIIVVTVSCRKDTSIAGCQEMQACEGFEVTDTAAVLAKLIGTWEFAGTVHYSHIDNSKMVTCDKKNKSAVVFNENKTVELYRNNALICTDTFTLEENATSSWYTAIYSDCATGRLKICNLYLTIVNSDVDGSDDYYIRVK